MGKKRDEANKNIELLIDELIDARKDALVLRGVKMLFVSDVCFAINDRKEDDPRIHKNVNCRYSDQRGYLDIIYQLIKADMLESDIKECDVE